MSARAYIVFCTFPEAESARTAARTLVEERLAACAQTQGSPITSVYRWQGELCEESEVLLLLKTSAGAWPRLRDRLGELHPYEVPQILACAAEGNEPYLRWLEENAPPPA